MNPTKDQCKEPIALIGSGCRFPGGASNPSRLWDLLKSPRDLRKKIPKDRFNIDAFYHPDGAHHGRTNARYAYFLEEDPYACDPSFFNIPLNEVETIDPQQRLLLETVYDSLSSAGLKIEHLRGSATAVYVGVMNRDFLDNQNYDLDALNVYAATGTSAAILANRVSYVFGWHGPCMTFDTACSSSLVAIHHAVQELRTGASRVAVAAGSNLILGPTPFIYASKLNMFSPTGRCRMWDAAADGYARGEGVAAVVLKTLTQAIADGDTIECVIRESGINQDGKTPGITMPNPAAQESLIRQVYEAAGLDVSKPQDRCQYFEAHGTGTPAGDPQEACAISSAFFGDRERTVDEEPLYVGSIKTIVGHTEGAAGVAGLIKASQVLQHGILPPNLLFNDLNPRVAPFYNDLQVVTKQQAWPTLNFNQPRRVSVNSFGFGGTNAHIIVESYKVAPNQTLELSSNSLCLAPIALSANSSTSLRAVMADLKQSISIQPEMQLLDLAWTLLEKQSNFQVRHTIQAKDMQALCDALERDASPVSGKQTFLTSDAKMKPRVLGIFTGQGAQWPAMGKALISQIAYARRIISDLDDTLQNLPAVYRPSWTLMDQLLLEGEDSNVHDAAFSQPLCCAVQIMLTVLLEAAGVTFKAVIGHSSGEIASAFAAGFVSASQAICIAHLRGLATKYAAGPDGVEGAMMAVGTSFDDANEFCALDAFKGRLTVAASNGPDTITLSGDKDAILEAYDIFIDESRFARVLKVDKAYHSHHVVPCAEFYVGALKACGCDRFTSRSEHGTTWLSSVYEGKFMRLEDLNAEYWKENLLSPVLFSFAVELAVVKQMPLDVCIEVGAHPALKSPTLQTIQNCIGSDLPYVSCMERKRDDIEAFSSCLGSIWSHFGSAGVNADSLYGCLYGNVRVRDVSKQLPSYPFDHSRSYKKESRALRAWLGSERPHLLLGKQSAHSTSSSIHWQNFIRQRDIEWLSGHAIQGQTVFPGAAYIVMAMEAALKLANDRSIKLLEVLNLKIGKAVTFENESSMVELNSSFQMDISQSTNLYAVYTFTIDSSLARETGLSRSVIGTLAVTYGIPALEALPAPQREPPHLNDISIDKFYHMLDKIGYGYTKHFRGISSLRRGDNKACGTIDVHHLEDYQRDMIIHPATLDVAFQSFIGAYTVPGDRRLRSPLLPTGIDRIALSPWATDRTNVGSSQVKFMSTSAASVGKKVEGDIEVFDPITKTTMLHIEGLSFKPFMPPSATDDHEMFCRWRWSSLNSDPFLDDAQQHATKQDEREVVAIERITYWYIKSFLASLTTEDRENPSFHFAKYISWCKHVLVEAQAGGNAWYNSEWDQDTKASIEEIVEQNISHPFVRVIQRVNEGALDVFRNDANAFDLLDHDGLLTEFYSSPAVFGVPYHYFQRLLEQVNHRFKGLNVLEIGAGTGGATRYFLNHEQLSFNSYTFTDISSTFFEQAAEEFERHAEKIHFRSLDIRRDPSEQGFVPNSYDLVIASNVFHATPKLEETLKNARVLLKPGGRLIVIEVAHREHTRIGYIFGLFSDWWAGHDDGRELEPFISYDRWEEILKRSGFSGIDSRTLDPDSRISPTGVFLTHAVNESINKLDTPLSASFQDSLGPFVVVGGSSPQTASLVDRLTESLPAPRTIAVASLRDILDSDLSPGSTFIMLSEVDEPTFANLDNEKFDSLQTLFNAARSILWVTEDAWVKNPQQAMTIGFLRSLRHEYRDIQIQVLDVDSAHDLEPHFLIETALRLTYRTGYEDDGLLWTQEPELYLSHGKVLVPRLELDTDKNHRLNSGRRQILVEASPRLQTLSLHHDEEQPFFRVHEDLSISLPNERSFVTIEVQYSLAKPLRIGELGFSHLIQGTVAGPEDGIVVALSNSNASQVQISPSNFVRLGRLGGAFNSSLWDISAHIIALTLMSGISRGSTVLILDAPASYVESLLRQATIAGISLTIAFTDVAVSGIPYIHLHEKETERSLRQKLPVNVSLLCDFIADQHPASLSRRLSRILPSSCIIRGPDYLFQHSAIQTSTDTTQAAVKILADAVEESKPRGDDENIPVFTANEFLSSKSPAINAVIDWTRDELITSRIQPITTENMFVGDRTYLLIGLTGDMGRSIARFMIEHGARYIVLSSRAPKIDQRWIDEIALLGGRIMVVPMDISNEPSVDKGLAAIRASMPTISGIAFGPLLLQDVTFKNMELPMMEMVLAPKVEGARFLNERFSDPENPLDFFVMFSSFVMVGGNPGQAAYSAANAYIHAVTQQRRARGMAASTIDIGAVVGLGFIARTWHEHEEALKFLSDDVNEPELHTLFAEAVVAGRHKDIEDVEIITGMSRMEYKYRDNIHYFNDSRLSAFRLSERQTSGKDAKGAIRSTKDQLLEANNLDQVRAIILEGLSSRIRGVLLFSPGDDLNVTTPLIDNGVDSLSAVTIASWFTKNLDLDVPFLKILGGASAADLVEEVVPRLDSDTIPLVDTESLAEMGSSGKSVPAFTPSSTMSNTDGGQTSNLEQNSFPALPARPSQIAETVGPLSIMQEYSWKQMQLPLHPSTFNTTIGMYMQGPIDLTRLHWAFDQVLQRNVVFRTRFVDYLNSSITGPGQIVMETSQASFQAIEVADRSAADEAFSSLERTVYDLEKGVTFNIIDYYWTPNDHLLIIAYHRLVGDGSTTELLFKEASCLYSGLSLEPAPSYLEYAIRQRSQLTSSVFDADLMYWSQLYQSLPPRLPLLSLPLANPLNSTIPSWTSHERSMRLSRMVAVRIKDRSRKHQVTPMHYYLASFHILLARLTAYTDITIGVADSGRASLIDQATMGYCASYLPIRLSCDSSDIFDQILSATKEQMRTALLHSAVPYPVILEHLGLPTSPNSTDPFSQAPLFQAVFDYKQGQAESGSIGECKMVETRTPRAGTPFDVTMEMSDDPSKGEPLITVKLQRERYGPADAEVLLDAYSSILGTFSRNPMLRVTEGVLDQSAKAKSRIGVGS